MATRLEAETKAVRSTMVNNNWINPPMKRQQWTADPHRHQPVDVEGLLKTSVLPSTTGDPSRGHERRVSTSQIHL